MVGTAISGMHGVTVRLHGSWEDRDFGSGFGLLF
jgi:hypothetical protein